MRALLTFDTLNLPTQKDRLLFEEADLERFTYRMNRLKRYILMQESSAVIHPMGSRVIWTKPNPSKWQPDGARTLCIVQIEKDTAISLGAPTRLEEAISEQIWEAVDRVIHTGYDRDAIPMLFANAASLVLGTRTQNISRETLKEDKNATD